jgi:hypothetical protein
MQDEHPQILEAIRTEKQISDATGAKIKSVMDAYAKGFTP